MAKGIDVLQTSSEIIQEVFLQDSTGAKVTTGTTTIAYDEVQDGDGTLKSYDFNDNTFKATALTTATANMTHQQRNNNTVNTGIWTHRLATLTGFTKGKVYIVEFNNSGASPPDQRRKFQWGSAEGDLVVNANNYLEAGMYDILGTAPTEGAGGRLAAAFTKFFDKATPTGTINSIPDAIPGAANGLFIAGTNAATSITTALTANIIGNITGALSGAVGSVTAAVTISAASVQAIWDALTSALTTSNSIGKYIIDSFTTLLARLSAIRAGNLDFLSGDAYSVVQNGTYGNSALLTAINNLNNLSALANLFGPDTLPRPSSGSIIYPFTFIVKNELGQPVDVDANLVTLTAANGSGTDRSANLSAVTHSGTGEYTFTYTVASLHTAEGLAISAAGTVLTVSRKAYLGAEVADAGDLSDIGTILTNVNTLLARLTSGRATGLDNLDATISSRLATAGYTAPDNTDITTILSDVATLLSRLSATRAGNMDNLPNLDAAISAVLAYPQKTVIRGTAAGGGSTTSIPTSAFSVAGVSVDQFNGGVVIFDLDTATTALRGQKTAITHSSVATLPALTVNALTTAPVSGDSFSVV